MKLASGLLSPIIFEVFLAVLCLPIVRWLQRKGLPTWASLLLLIVGVLTLGGRDRHPVVHIAYEDAEAYATWAGKAMPSEVEWEFAARGGLEGAAFVWSDKFIPKGRMLANTWQSEFPWQTS
jgi:formylglycine-generating enzyme required for sulfatase activity